jgi:uncharacterized membrane protein
VRTAGCGFTVTAVLREIALVAVTFAEAVVVTGEVVTAKVALVEPHVSTLIQYSRGFVRSARIAIRLYHKQARRA